MRLKTFLTSLIWLWGWVENGTTVEKAGLEINSHEKHLNSKELLLFIFEFPSLLILKVDVRMKLRKLSLSP